MGRRLEDGGRSRSACSRFEVLLLELVGTPRVKENYNSVHPMGEADIDAGR